MSATASAIKCPHGRDVGSITDLVYTDGRKGYCSCCENPFGSTTKHAPKSGIEFCNPCREGYVEEFDV